MVYSENKLKFKILLGISRIRSTLKFSVSTQANAVLQFYEKMTYAFLGTNCVVKNSCFYKRHLMKQFFMSNSYLLHGNGNSVVWIANVGKAPCRTMVEYPFPKATELLKRFLKNYRNSHWRIFWKYKNNRKLHKILVISLKNTCDGVHLFVSC